MTKGGVENEGIAVKKGPWTRDEDTTLISYILRYGHGSWRSLPTKAGLQREGKSCRLRWMNYLRPDIKRGNFSFEEEQTIIRLHALLGNRWSAIAAQLPMRTDNEIKNYWNTHIKKKLTKMGIHPTIHKPKLDVVESNFNHMAQWESTRLQAEARLGRGCSTNYNCNYNPVISFKPAKTPQCLYTWHAGDNWLQPDAAVQYYDENPLAPVNGETSAKVFQEFNHCCLYNYSNNTGMLYDIVSGFQDNRNVQHITCPWESDSPMFNPIQHSQEYWD